MAGGFCFGVSGKCGLNGRDGRNGLARPKPQAPSLKPLFMVDLPTVFPYHVDMINDSSRENLCRRCGRCCYAKLVFEEEMVFLPFPCPHLDEKTRLCKVYERRFEVNPDCLTLDEGIRLGVFPADCPYVAGLKGYKPPRENCTTEEINRYWNADNE